MKRTSLALVLLASIVRLLGGFAVWTARQILNTDDWVETSSELHASDVLSDEELAAEKSGYRAKRDGRLTSHFLSGDL